MEKGLATEKELKEYMGSIYRALDTKYRMLKEAFRGMDKDRSHHLTKAEIVQTVQHFSLPIPLDHIHDVFDRVLDKNSDGAVEYGEFCEAMKKYELGGN